MSLWIRYIAWIASTSRESRLRIAMVVEASLTVERRSHWRTGTTALVDVPTVDVVDVTREQTS